MFDVDGDGVLDIVFNVSFTGSGVALARGRGDGTFEDFYTRVYDALGGHDFLVISTP